MRVRSEEWPSHWDTKPLGELCDIQLGKTPPRKVGKYWNGTHTWLSISDMKSRVVNESAEQITDEAFQENKARWVSTGTLMMSFKLTIGKLAFAGKRLATNEAIAALDIRPKYEKILLPNFLYWALQAIPLEKDALFAVKGKTLNKKSMKVIDIPLPDPNEQQRIVSVIEALMSEVRDMQGINDEVEKDVNRLTDSVLADVYYVGQPLPESWIMKTMSEVSAVNPRRPSITRDDDEPTSFVPMADVDEFEGKFKQIQIRPYTEVRSGYTYFEENDVLFAKITPSMENGKTAVARGLIDGFGFGTTEFHVFRPNKGILPDWIHYYIRRVPFRNEAKQHFRGAVGQQRVPTEFLETYEIPVPFPNEPARSIDTQKRIIERIKAVEAEVRDMRRDTEHTGENITHLEQSILAQAFRGEL